MDIKITGTKTESLPRMQPFSALIKGADAYDDIRTGQTVTVKGDDGEVEAIVVSVEVGPLIHVGSPGFKLGYNIQHYSNFGRGADARNVIDAVETLYGKGKAIDPRTTYTAVVLQIPHPPITV